MIKYGLIAFLIAVSSLSAMDNKETNITALSKDFESLSHDEKKLLVDNEVGKLYSYRNKPGTFQVIVPSSNTIIDIEQSCSKLVDNDSLHGFSLEKIPDSRYDVEVITICAIAEGKDKDGSHALSWEITCDGRHSHYCNIYLGPIPSHVTSIVPINPTLYAAHSQLYDNRPRLVGLMENKRYRGAIYTGISQEGDISRIIEKFLVGKR